MKVVRINLIGIAVIGEPLTACIGYFGSLYLGHQRLIEEMKHVVARRNTRCTLIAFDPDPWCVIRGLQDIAHIMPMKQRMRIVRAMGIEYWIILDFSREMADLIPQDFHEGMLRPLRLDMLVCGYDFHYGRKGEGDTQSLHEQTDFDVHAIGQVSSEHRKINSSRVEELIRGGDVERAARFMRRWCDTEGSVKRDSHIGRKNGFPATNLRLQGLYVVPEKGVCVGAVKALGVWHRAIMNVGNSPTYNYQEAGSTETHLLDFDQDIYGEPVVFRFLSYIREGRKFPGIRALGEQLKKDPATARSYLEKGKESALCD